MLTGIEIKPSKYLLAWSLLGFYRGFKQYSFLHNRTKSSLNPFYFIDAFLNGCLFSFVYFMPLSLPFTLTKEIRRLEINIRNMENQFEKDNYYNLF